MGNTNPEIPLPKIGDDIYVPTRMYLSHGCDDIIGGLAKVQKIQEGISGGVVVHFIGVVEVPDLLNWEHYLFSIQDKLKSEFGLKRAHPDPDYHTSCND